jgi:hypothetical protein
MNWLPVIFFKSFPEAKETFDLIDEAKLIVLPAENAGGNILK